MPVHDFIIELREKIGHALLWLTEANQMLLVRRADNLRWMLITGCLEPGEQPAYGIVREILEEAG